MRKLQNILSILILIHISNYLHAGVFKGKVIDRDTNESVVGANVILGNSNFGCATNMYGEFLIENIPSGIYSVKLSSMGYTDLKDTIKITDEDEIVNKEYILGFGIVIEDDPEIEKYHSYLDENCKSTDILSIKLDSIFYDGKFLYYDATVSNNTDTTIYLPDSIEYWSIFSIYLTNDALQIVAPNLRGDVDFANTTSSYPRGSDIIEIRPNCSYSYKDIKVSNYDFSRLHKATYTVSLIYQFNKPKYINKIFLKNRDPNKIMNTISKYVRGKYYSDNYLSFKNY